MQIELFVVSMFCLLLCYHLFTMDGDVSGFFLFNVVFSDSSSFQALLYFVTVF